MIPRIVLCMGAEKVVAVGNARSGSINLGQYEIIVVKDMAKDGYGLPLPKVVTISWVKDCLFSSRLLPLPNARKD